jgi:hypothetical protein
VGRFSYDNTVTVDFDDRTLAHLQAVIGAKLRRGESFMLSWIDDAAMGSGHTSVWLNPASTLAFKYFGGRMPALNRGWVEKLMMSANFTEGLHVLPEPSASRARADGSPADTPDPA